MFKEYNKKQTDLQFQQIQSEQADLQFQQIQSEQKGRLLLKRYLIFFAFILAIVFSFWLGVNYKEKDNNLNSISSQFLIDHTKINDQNQEQKLNFSLFWKVWELLNKKYVDSSSLDPNKLFYGAIKGMLAATGDPYTTFFDPEENKRFNQEISQSFDGIGVEMGIKKGILTVIAPLKESPAEKAGIRAGDKIIKVDDKIIADLSIEEAVSLIRGPKETEVKLTILREKEEITQDIIIKRKTIKIKSVEFELKGDFIGYLKISQFGEETFKEFTAIQNQIISKNIKFIILDLRNNPGGYLDDAINIASKMIPKGKIVVIEENQKGEKKNILTRGGDTLSQIRTIVLINGGSASASEILAAALRENRDNITLIGTRSFGKGSVQEMIDLQEKTAMKITVAKWLTPNGEQINEKGITPDIEVEFTSEDYQNNRDPQLEKALEILNKEIEKI